jgi:hypothetical protein
MYGGISMTEFGRVKTSDGIEIQITKDMIEDFYIISKLYDVSIRDFIQNIFDGELQTTD